MDQHLADGRQVEVARFKPKEDVGREQQRGHGTAEEHPVIIWWREKPGDNAGDDHGDVERRQQSPGAPFVKGPEGKLVSLKVGPKQSRNQIAGDDEEDIDADEATFKSRDAVVKT